MTCFATTDAYPPRSFSVPYVGTRDRPESRCAKAAFEKAGLGNGMRRFAPHELPPFKPAYTTSAGAMYQGDARELLRSLPEGSVNLVSTSPPYALQSKKEYGNVKQHEYVDWLRPFAREIFRVLTDDGSFVLNIGGSYNAGTPTRSMYHFRTLLMLCDDIGFHLAQECFWYNPGKLPSPAIWVNIRRVRLKESVEYVWWLSKGPMPKADNRRVLVEYSPSMRREFERGIKPRKYPSGHAITGAFVDRGGAIPSNLLKCANSDSNSNYFRLCRLYGIKPHPARFPAALPEFYIKFLTEPGDLVLDVFAGSNTTGAVAEKLGRRWLAFEIEPRYVNNSRLRFAQYSSEKGD